MTEFAKNAQKPCQAFFSKKHPKIEQISDDFKSNLLYAALPKGHVCAESIARIMVSIPYECFCFLWLCAKAYIAR